MSLALFRVFKTDGLDAELGSGFVSHRWKPFQLYLELSSARDGRKLPVQAWAGGYGSKWLCPRKHHKMFRWYRDVKWMPDACSTKRIVCGPDSRDDSKYHPSPGLRPMKAALVGRAHWYRIQAISCVPLHVLWHPDTAVSLCRVRANLNAQNLGEYLSLNLRSFEHFSDYRLRSPRNNDSNIIKDDIQNINSLPSGAIVWTGNAVRLSLPTTYQFRLECASRICVICSLRKASRGAKQSSRSAGIYIIVQ